MTSLIPFLRTSHPNLLKKKKIKTPQKTTTTLQLNMMMIIIIHMIITVEIQVQDILHKATTVMKNMMVT